MGRSRITRTFHNKPVSKPKKGPVGKPKNTVVKPTNTTYKRRAGKIVYKKRDENIRRPVPGEVKNDPTQRGNLLPQAHAQESKPISVNPQGKYGTIDSTEDQIIGEKWGSFQFTIDKTGKPRGRNVKIRTTTRTDGVADTTVRSKYTTLEAQKYSRQPGIIGKFAQGVSNEAQDMVGIPHGFITGNNYKPKSILSRATEHVLAGDWGSAGKVISDNPYRFAGNIATTVGTGFIPFGAVTRGAGLAARVGSAVTKGKSKIVGKLKGKGAEKKSYAGGKYTNKEINDAERLVQQSEWMGWGKVKSRQTGLGFSEKVYKKKGAVSRHKNRKEQRAVDAEQATERRIDNFTGRSTGTPKWYQPREQFLAKTKGSRARLSRDRQQAEIRGSENRYNARIADNYENTKPTKNSFWQNQVTKDGDDVSGWVDPDFFR